MRSIDRRVAASAFLGTFLWFAYAAPAHAQTWPSRPVTMIVPFAAGTSSDVIARGLARELSEKLGQPFIVENKTGAGGNIGGVHGNPSRRYKKRHESRLRHVAGAV